MTCDCEDEEEDEADEEQKFEVETGAGWMHVKAEGRTPDEALDHWARAWDKVIEDVKDLDADEREKAGLVRGRQ